MIAHLTGQVFSKTTQSVLIDTGGIGYEVFVPLSTFYTLPEKNEKASLHIYTHVREDALLLFGFHSKLEKKLFLMLISVSGIGPKLAVNILSGIGPEELLGAIARGDTVRLRAIPGIGKKTAERIALELKEAFGGTVTVLHVGPAANDTIIRKGLAIGADDAVRINAEPGSALFVAKQIAAFAGNENYDIIFLGKETIDYNGSDVGHLVSEFLELPFISYGSKLEMECNKATLSRDIEGGVEVVEV